MTKKVLKEREMQKSAARLLVTVIILLSACSPRNPSSPIEATEPIYPLPNPTETPIPVTDLPSYTDTPEEIAESTDAEEPQVDTPVITPPPEAAQVIGATTATRYILQIGSPVAMANFIAPEAGCNWLGVGGQAFDLTGNPVANLVVEVGGTLEGSEVFYLALTGNSTNLGPGGFIINLANHVVASTGTLWIILYDLAGQPLTSRISFRTYADCAKNFIMINYVEMNADFVDKITLPLIMK